MKTMEAKIAEISQGDNSRLGDILNDLPSSIFKFSTLKEAETFAENKRFEGFDHELSVVNYEFYIELWIGL